MSDPAGDSRIGIIGNDEYGAAIAQRIAACGRRAVYAALPGSPDATTALKRELSPTSTDVASACPVMLAAIEDTETLRALVLGTAESMGLVAQMQPGSLFVDLGARTPRELHALLALLGTGNAALVDAAVIGGLDAIAEGRAKILLGGSPDAIDLASAALSLLGSVERTGPLGSAHAAAALMGYIEAAHAVACEEALVLGHACGLAPETLKRVLSEESLPRGRNVLQLARRAPLARRIAEDRGVSADIIDLATKKRQRQRPQRENR
jgi:3-hydroxyisobutyrate dehydrogenase